MSIMSIGVENLPRIQDDVTVPPGYKKTEVGIIPEDWEVKPLKRISPRQSVGLVINPSTYFDKAGTVPILVGSNVSENSIDSTSANRITSSSNEMLSTSRLAAGDLVTVRVGDPGVTAVVPPELDGCNCASMMIVRRHPSFDSHWLCSAMNSRQGRRQVEHVQYGTAQKQFNISDAVDFCYPVPPVPEQRAIAAALTNVDALLAALERIIAKNRAVKLAAMQQLLTGRTRLSEFQGKWEPRELKQIIRDFIVPMRDKPKRFGGGVPWCRIEDFEGKYLSGSKSGQCVDDSTIREMNLKVHPPGTLLVSCSANLGKCAIVRRPLVTNQTFIGLVADHSIASTEFLFYYFSFNAAALNNQASGTTISYLSRKQFEAFPVIIPAQREEQMAIANILSDMDAEIAALEWRREKAKAIRQGMMQALLTGRIRLVQSEVGT